MSERIPIPIILSVKNGMFEAKEIVFCKDCIWWCECRTKDKFPYKKDSCNKFGTKMNADDFCSQGKLK